MSVDLKTAITKIQDARKQTQLLIDRATASQLKRTTVQLSDLNYLVMCISIAQIYIEKQQAEETTNE